MSLQTIYSASWCFLVFFFQNELYKWNVSCLNITPEPSFTLQISSFLPGWFCLREEARFGEVNHGGDAAAGVPAQSAERGADGDAAEGPGARDE